MGLAGLEDRSRRPRGCAHQASAEVEALVCELRRHHPRWGSRRIAFELGRHGCPDPVPSRMTVYRILVRNGLIDPAKHRRGRKDYVRWQRSRPMELRQMDIVGGIMLADGTEAKVVTGVDDHSRFCVIDQVVRRATGRAVCLAFADGLQRFGAPEEVLTDNGKQFTERFGKGGEVMFDRICRENGIIHRLTQPASPTTTGKVERLHQTLRRELLDEVPVWPDLETVQAAVDVFRHEYNTDRPHQSLDMAFPADRFIPVPERVVPVKLPARLTQTADQALVSPPAAIPLPIQVSGPVEFERVVPPSGNLQVAGKQF
nr:IS481 family transposase [Micromonospora pallida]